MSFYAMRILERVQAFCTSFDYWDFLIFPPSYVCPVLLQVPKYFVPVQIYCAGPKIYLHIVPVTNILCQTKRWIAFSKIGFCAGTKVFENALNAVKFLGWLKKFGPAQNILEPVKGQGIRFYQIDSKEFAFRERNSYL